MNKVSALRQHHNKQRFEIAASTFANFREIVAASKEKFVTDLLVRVSKDLSINVARAQFIGYFPRYAVETFAMVSIISLIIILSSMDAGLNSELFIPQVAVFGIVALRLLPSFQAVVSASTQFRVARPIWEELETYHLAENFTEKEK